MQFANHKECINNSMILSFSILSTKNTFLLLLKHSFPNNISSISNSAALIRSRPSIVHLLAHSPKTRLIVPFLHFRSFFRSPFVPVPTHSSNSLQRIQFQRSPNCGEGHRQTVIISTHVSSSFFPTSIGEQFSFVQSPLDSKTATITKKHCFQESFQE